MFKNMSSYELVATNRVDIISYIIPLVNSLFEKTLLKLKTALHSRAV